MLQFFSTLSARFVPVLFLCVLTSKVHQLQELEDNFNFTTESLTVDKCQFRLQIKESLGPFIILTAAGSIHKGAF